MPLPGSHRDKAMKKPLQEIKNDGEQEFLQEVNEPVYQEEEVVEEPVVEEEPKPKSREKKFLGLI